MAEQRRTGDPRSSGRPESDTAPARASGGMGARAWGERAAGGRGRGRQRGSGAGGSGGGEGGKKGKTEESPAFEPRVRAGRRLQRDNARRLQRGSLKHPPSDGVEVR